MAKALFGHVGVMHDPRMTSMASEVRRLQQRVRDLEGEVGRLQHENDILAALVSDDTMLVVDAARKQPEFV